MIPQTAIRTPPLRSDDTVLITCGFSVGRSRRRVPELVNLDDRRAEQALAWRSSCLSVRPRQSAQF